MSSYGYNSVNTPFNNGASFMERMQTGYDNFNNGARNFRTSTQKGIDTAYQNNYLYYFIMALLFLIVGGCIMNIINVALNVDSPTYGIEIGASAGLFVVCLISLWCASPTKTTDN